jgi:hypothetical protein
MRFIHDWQTVVHKLNRDKGFYDYEKDVALVEQDIAFLRQGDLALDTTIIDAVERILADYKKAMLERKLLLVIGELCEAHEELRAGHGVNEVYASEGGKPEGFPVEIADAQIRMLDVCESVGIDSEAQMITKHNYNSTRPYKHGKRF